MNLPPFFCDISTDKLFLSCEKYFSANLLSLNEDGLKDSSRCCWLAHTIEEKLEMCLVELTGNGISSLKLHFSAGRGRMFNVAVLLRVVAMVPLHG